MADAKIVRIAGAGPAGLTAAIVLARGGRTVEVFEAKQTVGARFIGDLQIIENSSERESVPDLLDRIGIERNFYFRPATEADFYDPRGRRRHISANTPYGYFIRRGPGEATLDSGLLAQAERAGVTIRFGTRCDPNEAEIVATGPAAADGLAKEITFRSDAPETIDVFFDHDIAPGGYFYLFILDGVGTFGCAIVADFKNIDARFERALSTARRLHDFGPVTDLRTGYSYMNFHLKASASAAGRPYAGEAGGFQDYLFGLGIRFAITSGHLAARSILEDRSYDELWREAMLRKQETSLVNRFLYERGGNFGLAQFVRRAASARDFAAYLSGWHRTNWWKRALAPVIKRSWRHEGRCLHKPGPHWCRARRSEIKVPPLGPADV